MRGIVGHTLWALLSFPSLIIKFVNCFTIGSYRCLRFELGGKGKAGKSKIWPGETAWFSEVVNASCRSLGYVEKCLGLFDEDCFHSSCNRLNLRADVENCLDPFGVDCFSSSCIIFGALSWLPLSRCSI